MSKHTERAQAAMSCEMVGIKGWICCQEQFSGWERATEGEKKKMDCVAERKDVAVMSSLFADIVLPVCLCILNDLADKVADELNEQKQRWEAVIERNKDEQ